MDTNLIPNPDQITPQGGKRVIEVKINSGRIVVKSGERRANTFTLILPTGERES